MSRLKEEIMATIDLIVLGMLKKESLSAYDITSSMVKEGRMAEKAVYSLTEQGNREFEHLMEEIASKPIHIFLDFNAVMVNLDSITPEKQKACLEKIEDNIKTLKTYLEENVSMKEGEPVIPRTGMAVLKQQQILALAVEDWIREVKRDLSDTR